MKSVPDEMIEAARLDTGSTLRIIWSIIVPSIKHGIICAWTLTFTEQWNMVAEPLVLMETQEKYPLAVMLNEIEAGDVLFCAAVFGFNYFGEDIREVMSPRVETVKIKYSVFGVVLPKEAVRTDESGHTYVMFAVKTDKYPEKGYEALRLDCVVVDTMEETDVVLSIQHEHRRGCCPCYFLKSKWIQFIYIQV